MSESSVMANRIGARSTMERVRRAGDIVSAVSLAALWVIPLRAWNHLPEKVPLHFGASGAPDGWGPKGSIFIVSGAGVFVTVVSILAPRLRRSFEVSATADASLARKQEIARTMSSVVRAEILLSMTWISRTIAASAEGDVRGLGAAFLPAFLGSLIVTIGVFLTLAGRGPSQP